MADTNLQAVIERLLKITHIGHDNCYRIIIHFCEPNAPDYDPIEDLALLPRVLRHFQKEISDRDAIIHDLKEDHPAYVLVISNYGGNTQYFPTCSLFEAKQRGEQLADKDAVSVFGWQNASIYDSHTCVCRLEVIDGEHIWVGGSS